MNNILFNRKDLPKLIGLVALYVLLAKLVVVLFAGNNIVGFLWLASGVALAVVLVGGNKYLPAVFLGAMLGYLLIGKPPTFALVAALRHTASIFLGIWLLKQEGRFNPCLHKLGDFLRVLVLAMGFGLFTTLSMQALEWLGGASFSVGSHSFHQRWMGHALGIVIIMPLVLVWRRVPDDWLEPKRIAEVILLLGLMFFANQIVFLEWFHDPDSMFEQVARGYWMFLTITLVAMRLRTHGVVIALFMTAAQALAGSIQGIGFFAHDIAKTQLVTFWFYMMTLSLVGMVLATYITERERAENALRENEDMLRAITDNASTVIFLKDMAGRYLHVNRLYEELFHVTNAAIQGKTDHDIFPEDVADAVIKNDQMVAQSGQTLEAEEQVPHDDGIHTYISVKFPIRNASGEIYAVCGIATDITERKEYEEELKRSNAELEQFSYAVSHDMRQPLRMISSYLQLLELGLADQLDNEKRDYFDFAIEGAKRIDQMLRALLEYSRAGRMGEPPTMIESRAVLDEALQFLQPALDEAQAKLNITGEWPCILVSYDEMQRLVQNLIGNAIKYRIAGRTPEINVTGEVVKNEWHLCVADNGIGIIPDQIKRLFQVFQRLQSREAYEGTGIGLALCRKIAEHHKGRIWAESAGEGKGSKFCVVLPLRGGG